MIHASDFAAVTMLHLADHSTFCVVMPQHPGLQAWSRALSRLRFLLRDIETEPAAERLRAALYGARLNCITSTLPFSHPAVWDAEREHEVRILGQDISSSLPEVAAVLDENLRLLHLLQLFATNPVAAAVQQQLDARRALPRPRTWPGYIDHRERWALVVRPSLLAAVREQWKHEPELVVTAPVDMTGDRVFEHVFFLGAAHRYPAALIANPHALGATLYRYPFIFDEEVQRPVTEVIREHGQDEFNVDTLPLLPDVAKVDWLPGRAMPAAVEVREMELVSLESEEQPALAWQDELTPESPGSAGALRDDTPTADVFREVTIATEQGQESLWLGEHLTAPRLHLGYPPSVEAVTGATVKVGDVLLLRTEGTQLSYSRDLARAEYGDAYLQASTVHAEFKARLQAAVDEAGGRRQAVKLMVRVGADRSCTVGNLSGWIKVTNFRPDSDVTYAAMLTFIGWSDRRAELDEAIRLLRSSHIFSGRRAGEERLNLLLQLDFTQLEQRGYLEVELGGGKVGAHRVLRVGDSCERLPAANGHVDVPGRSV